MPTIFRKLGFRFFFYSNEGNEPAHVHVEKGEGNGKYWLEPTMRESYMRSFSKKEEKQVKQIVKEEQNYFKQKWYEYFG
jgi:hypothetical protein